MSAAPLIFLHGWAASKEVWRLQKELGRDFRIFFVELRGHGSSPWQNSRTLLKDFTQDLREFCRQKKIRAAHFVAWSMAGHIILELAKENPQLLASAVLVNCTSKLLNSAGYSCGISAGNLNWLRRKLNLNPAAALDEFRMYMFSPEEKQAENFPQVWDILAQIPLPHSEALRLGLDLLEREDLRSRLEEVVVPTLIISGDNDSITPPA
ncbi:MAG: alpha/beta fold hydrolase, partial [Candidatus Omnitrophota bacterium]